MSASTSSARSRLQVPVAGPLTLNVKLSLATEILGTYVPALRSLRTNDVNHMIAVARAVRNPARPPSSERQRDLAIRLGWIVMRVLSVLPTDSRCLARSLVLSRMLARRSITSELVIGVRADEGFQAHAWVEHEGRPVLPAAGFHPIFRA